MKEMILHLQVGHTAQAEFTIDWYFSRSFAGRVAIRRLMRSLLG